MDKVSYSPTEWKNGVTRVNAKNMNNIEQGILYLYKYALELGQVTGGTGIYVEPGLDGGLKIEQSIRIVREEPLEDEREVGVIYYVIDDYDNLRKIIIDDFSMEVTQNDWKEMDRFSMSYIKNKPTIPDSIILSDENVLTISGQSFLLTPKPKDYYVGWFNGSAAEFEQLDSDTILDYATGYNVSNHPTFEGEFGENSLFFMLYRENTMPDEVIFSSAGKDMIQNFPGDSTVRHSKITIENRNYRYDVWGISHPGFASFDPKDRIKIMYSLKPQDYYIGWVNMSRGDFSRLTDEEILSIVSGYSTRLTPSYSGRFGENSLFFLMYQADKSPNEIIFTSGSLAMDQRFPGGSTVDHTDIVLEIPSTRERKTYKIWGISHPGFATFDPKDSVLINFK